MSNKKQKKNRPSNRNMKEKLFNTFGTICMLCENNFDKKDLQLHHLEKWEHTHTTTYEQSSLTCDICHKRIHKEERNDKIKYNILNNKIREYKKIYGKGRG